MLLCLVDPSCDGSLLMRGIMMLDRWRLGVCIEQGWAFYRSKGVGGHMLHRPVNPSGDGFLLGQISLNGVR